MPDDGFSSLAAFSRGFRKRFGMTPPDWRPLQRRQGGRRRRLDARASKASVINPADYTRQPHF